MSLVKSLLSVVLLSSVSSYAGVAKGADAQNIDQACASDATTAGCGSEQVGTGLLICLHKNKQMQKKTNKAFSYSSACEAAIEKRKEDHPGKKAKN